MLIIKPLRRFAMSVALLAVPAGALAAMTNVTSTSAATRPSTLKIMTGTYTAKAGTASFRFKVEAHTATNNCGASATAHCFIAITYPKIKAPCTDGGQPEDNAFSVPNGFINSAGHFSYHQNGPLISFSASTTGSRWTGTLREKDSLDTGDGPFTCDTGVVHWSAKRQ